MKQPHTDIYNTVRSEDIYAIVIPEEFMGWHPLDYWNIVLLDDVPLSELDDSHFYETYGGNI